MKVRRAPQAGAAEVVFSARVQKRAAACRAQRMGNQADLLKAGMAKIVLVLSDALPAMAAARGIKPVEEEGKTRS
jgi:hypothetical protein